MIRHIKWFVIMVAVLAVMGVWSNSVAQEAAEETAGAQVQNAAAEGETVTQEKQKGGGATFWQLVKQGGLIMFPLGLLSVGAIGLVVYGFMVSQTGKMLRPELVPSLQEELGKINLEGARQICNSNPSLLTNTLNAGLDRIKEDVLDINSMEKAMEEASVQETTDGLKPINYLSIIAQVAPMLGLLGTVSGMIKAFQKIGEGGMGDPELLAGNIGEAMVTTATGLIVGIPTMFFYFYLKTKYNSNVSQLSRILGNLSHHLVTAVRRGDNETPADGPAENTTEATAESTA